MDSLLTMINHLIGLALAERPGSGALQLRTLTLDGEGGHVVGRLEHPLARGEVVLRFRVESAQGGNRQSIRFHVVSAPEDLGDGVEPFRRLIETARLTLELDFSEEAP